MIALRTQTSCATSALYGRAGPVTFLASPRKVTKRRRPQRFACFLRCSRQAGVAEIAQRVARATRDHASGLTLRRLDRLPLRSSGRIHGDPVGPKFDRFAMRITGTRMQASGLRLQETERDLPGLRQYIESALAKLVENHAARKENRVSQDLMELEQLHDRGKNFT